ncbi:hypothetical protein OEZ85_008842 [Tetradesmus obliquus]|uniref:Leucine-rich repeat-containing N-terminal plant-type domain-containing protein n=1 Tax=Tetradesmus obliquus TaxID=3088 RepID=A0ABY8TPN9_TETOB|nr:hypothetical protein OEZ85_008842 [Tetradesmus obliquus]
MPRAASRVLLERDRGQEYGALVGSARRLAAESTQTGSTYERKGAEEAALLTLSRELAEADAAKLRWQPGTDHCKWPGVYCTDDNYVYLVDLSSQGIAGTLSDAVDLSALQELQSIWLQGNQLAGTLPASWFTLPSLRELLLYDNAIQGSLPAEALAATTGLRRLNLNGNRLSGSLPNAVSALSSLEALHLASNSFEGTVPAAFADLSKLKTLALYNNPKLSGCIPAALQSKQRPVRLAADTSHPAAAAAAAAADPALANTQDPGSKHGKVDPNLTVLEDDAPGKAQVYMEFEGHPSYVAASGSRARRKRVLM